MPAPLLHPLIRENENGIEIEKTRLLLIVNPLWPLEHGRAWDTEEARK